MARDEAGCWQSDPRRVARWSKATRTGHTVDIGLAAVWCSRLAGAQNIAAARAGREAGVTSSRWLQPKELLDHLVDHCVESNSVP